MKNLILSLFLLFLGYAVTGQITDPAYEVKVKKLMEIQMGQGMVMDHMIDQILPNIPEENQADFKKDINVVITKMMDKIAGIYMEIHTKEEVDALLEFYTSPIGKQIQGKLPLVMERSSKMGQEFGSEIMPIMQKYMH